MGMNIWQITKCFSSLTIWCLHIWAHLPFSQVLTKLKYHDTRLSRRRGEEEEGDGSFFCWPFPRRGPIPGGVELASYSEAMAQLGRISPEQTSASGGDRTWAPSHHSFVVYPLHYRAYPKATETSIIASWIQREYKVEKRPAVTPLYVASYEWK